MGSNPKNISGSRAASILGLSNYSTPFAVWQEILEELRPGFNAEHGYTLPEKPDNAAIRFGMAFEDAIAELSERETGKKILDREKLFERDFMSCHVDGLFEDGVLYEAKTTSSMMWRESWGEPNTDHIPRIYQCQIQHNMMLSRADAAILSVLVFPETPDAWEKMGWLPFFDKAKSTGTEKWLLKNDKLILSGSGRWSIYEPKEWADIFAATGNFHQYPCRANPAVQKLLVDKYRAFWERYVLTGTPPEPQNYEDVKRLVPEPKATIIVPDIIANKLSEYKSITEETAYAKKQKERIKTIVTKWAIKQEGVLDDESQEAVIMRNQSGKKVCHWSKKQFRVS